MSSAFCGARSRAHCSAVANKASHTAGTTKDHISCVCGAASGMRQRRRRSPERGTQASMEGNAASPRIACMLGHALCTCQAWRPAAMQEAEALQATTGGRALQKHELGTAPLTTQAILELMKKPQPVVEYLHRTHRRAAALDAHHVVVLRSSGNVKLRQTLHHTGMSVKRHEPLESCHSEMPQYAPAVWSHRSHKERDERGPCGGDHSPCQSVARHRPEGCAKRLPVDHL